MLICWNLKGARRAFVGLFLQSQQQQQQQQQKAKTKW